MNRQVNFPKESQNKETPPSKKIPVVIQAECVGVNCRVKWARNKDLTLKRQIGCARWYSQAECKRTSELRAGVWENNKIALCPRGCQRKTWITWKRCCFGKSIHLQDTETVGNRIYNIALNLPLVPVEEKQLNIQPGAKTTYVTC